ncbi:MAG: antitoxin [Candidatus Aureabacteria bacterium]|nr:antitoxin [Candidatus Auribacterota bacterium]
MKLNKEEKDLRDAFERGELKTVPHAKREMIRFQDYAKSALIKNKRVNIRISERDLIQIQKKAAEEGLPYQTLMSSVLHKYVTGQLMKKSA